jgi:hypothetical protein
MYVIEQLIEYYKNIVAKLRIFSIKYSNIKK